jgi:hypothetical protein
LKKREKTKKLKKQSKRLKLKEPDLDDDIKNIKTMVNFLLSYMEKELIRKMAREGYFSYQRFIYFLRKTTIPSDFFVIL